MKDDKKITVQATEIINADIEFISLVKRGANRSPFKMIKREVSQMALNLSNLFNKDTKKQEKGLIKFELVKLLIVKDDNYDAKVKYLTESKISYADLDDSETSLSKSEDKQDMIEFASGDIAVVSSVSKANHDSGVDGSQFSEMLGARGFLPSVDVAMRVLDDVIWNIAHSSDIPEIDSMNMNSALAEFHGYVLWLFSMTPPQILMIERAMTDAIAQMNSISASEETKTEVTPMAGDTSKKEDGAGGKSVEDVNKDEVTKVEDTKEVSKDESKAVEKAEISKDEALVASLTKVFSDQMAALTSSIDAKFEDVKKSQDSATKDAEDKIAEISEVVKTVKEGVQGTTNLQELDKDKVTKTEAKPAVSYGNAFKLDGFEI